MRKKRTTAERIRALLKEGNSPKQIATLLKIQPARIHTVIWHDKKRHTKTLTIPSGGEATLEYTPRVLSLSERLKVLFTGRMP